jgi:RNA polymerase sigma-70 factor (ECF subfamily)
MTDETTTDQDLAVRARRDQDAFITLYRRYVKRVYGYHLVRTNNEHDAQDLTSETFLAALASLENYRPAYSFGAWLMGIAYHKLMDHFRVQSPVVPLVKVPDPPAPDPTPEKQLSQQSDINAIHQALGELTEDRAGAISLRYFGGLNVAETARVMDKSRGAVKMLVMRGLRELRDHLDVVDFEEVNHE